MAVYKVPVLGTFSWQPTVKAIQNDPPGSPVKADRYLLAGTPTGAWTGHAWNVATYNGTGWDFDIPAEGWAAWDENANKFKFFNGTAWTDLTATPTAHEHAGADVTSGTLDGDRLPALSATKKGGAPATGTPTGKFLKDDGTWAAPAASVPTGTGFRKVVAGVEDAAAKLVENAEVAAAAGIVESKLALNNPTHATTNDPTADQKAALPGTSGTPSVSNKYVTDADARNTNARTPVAHASTHIPGAGDPVAGVGAYDADYKCLTFTI